jgi:hypothetical protein
VALKVWVPQTSSPPDRVTSCPPPGDGKHFKTCLAVRKENGQGLITLRIAQEPGRPSNVRVVPDTRVLLTPSFFDGFLFFLLQVGKGH